MAPLRSWRSGGPSRRFEEAHEIQRLPRGRNEAQVTENPQRTPKRDRIEKAGTVLVILGVFAWVVYAVTRWGIGRDVAAHQYLLFHLAGVIPGSILRRWRLIRRLFR